MPEAESPLFAGRACFLDLGGENRARLEFITTGYADHYSTLKATVLNRTDGAVDTLLFRFDDVWGKKGAGHPSYQSGLVPYIWTYNNKSEWYIYHPTDSDMKQLAAEVSGYLNVFTDRDLLCQKKQEKSSVTKKLHQAKQPSTQQKVTNKHKKTEPEL